MAKIHSSNARIYLDALRISPVTNDVTIGQMTDAADVTCLGASYRERISGLVDWTADIAGFFDSSTCAFDKKMADAIGASTILGVFPRGVTQGYNGYEGTPNETDYSVTGPVDGPIAVGITLSGSGRLSRTTLISVSSAMTVSTCGVGIDLATSRSNGIGFLRVTAASATAWSTGASVWIMDSATEGGTYVDVITFATLAASGAQTVMAAGSVDRWVKTSACVEGLTNPDIDMLVSVENY